MWMHWVNYEELLRTTTVYYLCLCICFLFIVRMNACVYYACVLYTEKDGRKERTKKKEIKRKRRRERKGGGEVIIWWFPRVSFKTKFGVEGREYLSNCMFLVPSSSTPKLYIRKSIVPIFWVQNLVTLILKLWG